MLSINLIGNYLTTGARSLARHKMHLALNIFGLSIGLAAALMVSLFTLHELSYDKSHPNSDRTYRILEEHRDSGGVYSLNSPHAFEYYKKIPGVEDYLGLLVGNWLINTKVIVNNTDLEIQKIYASTNSLMDFFDINVIEGDINRALTEPSNIALSESQAIRFFGHTKVLGEKLVSARSVWTVVAVFEDLPANTHLDMEAIVSADFALEVKGKASYTYLRLTEDAEVEQIEKDIGNIMAKIWPDDQGLTQKLQPIHDIHLSPNLREEMKVGGSQLAVNISIALSVLLVVIASFNSINMNVARAGQRAKEVGIRKTLGAVRGQLVSQFLIESVLVSMLSGLIACGLAELSLSEFNLLVGRDLTINYWGLSGALLLFFVGVVGLVSGLYPAFYISSFNAKRVLSGDLERGQTAIFVRKILLVIQSALSVGFIIVSFSIYSQLSYLYNFPVNYEKTNRLRVDDIIEGKIFYHQDLNDEALEARLRSDTKTLFEDLERIEGVVSATPTDYDFTRGANTGVRDFVIQGVPDFSHSLAYGSTGYNAVRALGLELIAGRDFNRLSDWYDSTDKSVAIMIPASTLALAGFSNAEEAIGKVAYFSAGQLPNVKGRIVGVFKDIKIGSVKDASFPMMLACGLSWSHTSSMIIEVEEDSPQIRSDIRAMLKERLNLNPIEIESMEDKYKLLYAEDSRLALLVLIFSTLVVCLTCVGMFGLAAFTANRRAKEIAIRKVLGASRNRLIFLLAKDYIILNGISLFIAFPIAYYLVTDWLQNFNERIEQSVFIYLLSGVMVTLLTALTISTITLIAANTRPNVTLRQN
ncbi:ABC transporter permease [Rheinheimera gaetbuli]